MIGVLSLGARRPWMLRSRAKRYDHEAPEQGRGVRPLAGQRRSAGVGRALRKRTGSTRCRRCRACEPVGCRCSGGGRRVEGGRRSARTTVPLACIRAEPDHRRRWHGASTKGAPWLTTDCRATPSCRCATVHPPARRGGFGETTTCSARSTCSPTSGCSVRSRSVRRGAVFNCNLEMEFPGPPLYRRSAMSHHVHGSGLTLDDGLSDYNTQSSTQWDGFRHVQHLEHGYYNGLASGRPRRAPLGPSRHRRTRRARRRGAVAGRAGPPSALRRGRSVRARRGARHARGPGHDCRAGRHPPDPRGMDRVVPHARRRRSCLARRARHRSVVRFARAAKRARRCCGTCTSPRSRPTRRRSRSCPSVG